MNESTPRPLSQTICEFTVAGEIVAWARPRFNFKTGVAFTDKTRKTYEGIVAKSAMIAYRRGDLMEGPVAVHIHATLAIPRSWSNKKREAARAGTLKPTGRPDADNIAKLVLDALQGVIYKIDTQVTDLYVTKRYGDSEALTVSIMAG